MWRDANLSPPQLSHVLASAARKARDELISSGQASPSYTTFVDGRRGASEDTVRLDGAILYKFNLLGLAATFAITYCIARSPVDSGDYRKAWFIAVDGKPYLFDLSDIPAGSEVIVSNPMPYARKIDVGGMNMSVPPGIVEEARQQTRRKFPTLTVSRAFLSLPAGNYPVPSGTEVPWILRGRSKTSRKDSKAGQAVTYPGLVISERI